MTRTSLRYLGALAFLSKTVSSTCAGVTTGGLMNILLSDGTYAGFNTGSLEGYFLTVPYSSANLGSFIYYTQGDNNEPYPTLEYVRYNTGGTIQEYDKLTLQTGNSATDITAQPEGSAGYGLIHESLDYTSVNPDNSYLVMTVDDNCIISFTVGANPYPTNAPGSEQYYPTGTVLGALDCTDDLSGETTFRLGRVDQFGTTIVPTQNEVSCVPVNAELVDVGETPQPADPPYPSTTTTSSAATSSATTSSATTSSATTSATTSSSTTSATTSSSTTSTSATSTSTTPSTTTTSSTSSTSASASTSSSETLSSTVSSSSSSSSSVTTTQPTVSVPTTTSALTSTTALSSLTTTSPSAPGSTGNGDFNVEVIVRGVTYYGAASVNGALSLTTDPSKAVLFTYDSAAGTDQLLYIDPTTGNLERLYVPLNEGLDNPVLVSTAFNPSIDRAIDTSIDPTDDSLAVTVPSYASPDYELNICNDALWTIATDENRVGCSVVDAIYAVEVSNPLTSSASFPTTSATGTGPFGSSTSIATPSTVSNGSIPSTSSQITVTVTAAPTGSSPTPVIGAYEYEGCFGLVSLASFVQIEIYELMTIERCIGQALAAGYRYAGLHFEQCIASSSFNVSSAAAPGICDIACPGNPAETCGGDSTPSKMMRRQLAPLSPLFSVYGYTGANGLVPYVSMTGPAVDAATTSSSGDVTAGGDIITNSVNTIDSDNTIINSGNIYGDLNLNFYAGQVYSLNLSQVYVGQCGCADELRTMTYTTPCTFTACGCATEAAFAAAQATSAIPMTTSLYSCSSCGSNSSGQTVTLTLPVGAPSVGPQGGSSAAVGAPVSSGALAPGVPSPLALNAAITAPAGSPAISGVAAATGIATAPPNAVGTLKAPTSAIPYATTNNADKVLGSVSAVMLLVFVSMLVAL